MNTYALNEVAKGLEDDVASWERFDRRRVERLRRQWEKFEERLRDLQPGRSIDVQRPGYRLFFDDVTGQMGLVTCGNRIPIARWSRDALKRCVPLAAKMQKEVDAILEEKFGHIENPSKGIEGGTLEDWQAVEKRLVGIGCKQQVRIHVGHYEYLEFDPETGKITYEGPTVRGPQPIGVVYARSPKTLRRLFECHLDLVREVEKAAAEEFEQEEKSQDIRKPEQRYTARQRDWFVFERRLADLNCPRVVWVNAPGPTCVLGFDPEVGKVKYHDGSEGSDYKLIEGLDDETLVSLNETARDLHDKASEVSENRRLYQPSAENQDAAQPEESPSSEDVLRQLWREFEKKLRGYGLDGSILVEQELNGKTIQLGFNPISVSGRLFACEKGKVLRYVTVQPIEQITRLTDLAVVLDREARKQRVSMLAMNEVPAMRKIVQGDRL